jgi:hypothetical protein
MRDLVSAPDLVLDPMIMAAHGVQVAHQFAEHRDDLDGSRVELVLTGLHRKQLVTELRNPGSVV